VAAVADREIPIRQYDLICQLGYHSVTKTEQNKIFIAKYKKYKISVFLSFLQYDFITA
jgi:hypothetical protein